MLKLSLLLFIIFFLLLPPLDGYAAYTFPDLTKLYEEKNFKEFLEHAQDIRPSNRDESWNKMLEEMSILYLDSILEKKEFSSNHFSYIEKLSHLPALKNSDIYHMRRAGFLNAYFNKCFKEGRLDCKWSALSVLPSFGHSIHYDDLSVSLGERLARDLPKEELIPFFEKPIKSNVASFYCKGQSVRPFLLKKAIEQNGDMEKLLSLASRDCWDGLATSIKGDLYKVSMEEATRYYSLLTRMNLLNDLEKRTFQLTYILTNPNPSELFNESWNNLDTLSKDFALRKRVLKNIESLDPLPGKIFKLEDAKKRTVLMEHFSQAVPEYLDLYARTCLAYYRGSRKFKQGNPTVECHDLFEISKGKNWVNTGLKAQYQTLPLNVIKK